MSSSPTPSYEGRGVPEGFTLPWNTEWSVADSWGLTERQCRNVKYRSERLHRRRPSLPSQRDSVWTLESLVKLRKLWGRGLSYRDIARKLGPGFTKNAVACKARRLDLPARKPDAVRKVA